MADGGTDFGSLLRRYRTEAGLTQEELAERAGLSGRAVSDLERGARTRPWHDTILRLADALALKTKDRQILESSIARSRRQPTASLSTVAEPVPAEVTPLIGREREEAAVVHLLRDGDVRLLTLTGTGGVGKTRLALRVARSAAALDHDGARFVSLAPVRSAVQIEAAIARVLGLQETRGQALGQSLLSTLARRSILLILDNFEHVLDAAPLLSDLLAACPDLSLLVTSREALHIQGEQEFQVQPLAMPPETAVSAEAIARYPASTLFLARARAVKPMATLDDDDAALIAAICRRLDGLPLAIELAAAQLKYMSPRQLLAGLDRRFGLLVGGPRNVPTRQQTMRDCVTWSYDLLKAEQRAVLEVAAVFTGGCTMQSLAAVSAGAGVPHPDVPATVRTLVDKSLLIPASPHQEQPRFTMMETIRDYALDQLRERGALEAANAAYALYYLDVAEEAERAMWGPGEADWYRRLATERDNLREVLAWAAEHDPGVGLRIGGGLRRFWNMDGHHSQWLDLLDRALTSTRPISPSIRARGMLATGWLALHRGDIGSAVSRLHDGLEGARSLSDRSSIWVGATGLGLARLGQRDVPAALALFDEGMEIARKSSWSHLLGPVLYSQGLAFQVQGDDGEAARRFEAAIASLEAHGELYTIESAQRALGGIELARGNAQRALGWFQRGLRAALLTEHRGGIAGALEEIAAALAALGRLGAAAELWGAAQTVNEEVYGTAAVPGEMPFARLPHISPHLAAVSRYFDDPAWERAEAKGRSGSLQGAVDRALAAQATD